MNTCQTVARYRPDIDGLRAIAVILVIIFHANSGWLASGFIGVDIFFVISGYLITGIILTQISEKRFSLNRFFISRLWRIQPALITVSLATLLVASFLYVIPDYLTFLKSAKYNSLFLSNQFFAKQSVTYASPQSEFFPLLHTWSLSVEWQWYLFLPLIVLAWHKLLKRSGIRWVQDEKKKNVYIALLFVVITAALSTLSIATSHKSPGASYYFLITRAFEFTAGSSAFLLGRMGFTLRPALLSLLSGLALGLIFFTALQTDLLNIYPGIWTLGVVLASTIVLFSGHYGEKLISGLMTIKPVVFTGKLSYSLYLWHWPIFAFCRYLGIALSGFNLLLALTAIVLLSAGSYFLIEEPLRKKRLSFKWTFSLLVLLPLLLFNGLYALAVKHHGFPQRLGQDYARQQHVLDEYLAKSGNRENCLNNTNDPAQCQLGDAQGARSALVIGDSNSNHFWGFFDVLAKAAGVKVNALSVSSCLTLPGIWQFDWWIYKDMPYTECHDRTQNYFQLIQHNHYNFVVIGEIWEQYANGPHLINNTNDVRSDALSKTRMNSAVRKALDIIIASGARPVFIKTIFPMPSGYQECINRHAVRRSDFNHEECNQRRAQGSEDAYITSLFAQLKKEYPSLLIIDPKDIQCAGGQCISQIDGIPLYRDVGHLTDYASYRFGEIYLEQKGNPFSG